MFEPGEDEYVFRSALADQAPGPLQFAKIIFGGGKDPAARIGQVWRVLIAETIGSPSAQAAGIIVPDTGFEAQTGVRRISLEPVACAFLSGRVP